MADGVSVLVRTGVGYTVMVKLFDEPVQLTDAFENEGDTVMVAVIVVVPLLTAENAGIEAPDPLAASPIEGVLFVQV
jgi:hypothetical protein